MKRVVGVGGVFFKAKDPEKLRAWYRDHLGFILEEWGGVIFKPSGESNLVESEQTVWSLFKTDSDYFAPSTQPFMINYRVDDLDVLLAELRKEGCAVDEKTMDDPTMGKFGWVMDPENNRVELWEPPKKQN